MLCLYISCPDFIFHIITHIAARSTIIIGWLAVVHFSCSCVDHPHSNTIILSDTHVSWNLQMPLGQLLYYFHFTPHLLTNISHLIYLDLGFSSVLIHKFHETCRSYPLATWVIINLTTKKVTCVCSFALFDLYSPLFILRYDFSPTAYIFSVQIQVIRMSHPNIPIIVIIHNKISVTCNNSQNLIFVTY